MKRSIQVVGGLGLAAGVVLGVTPAASAHETHHKHAEKSACATKCRPPKTPPPGGWPCKADHSCASRHHYKPCPPTPTPKPPVVLHPKPKPPAVTPPKPVVHDAPKTPVARAVPGTPQLALTGGFYQAGLEGGGVLLLMGGVLVGLTRQPRQYTKEARR